MKDMSRRQESAKAAARACRDTRHRHLSKSLPVRIRKVGLIDLVCHVEHGDERYLPEPRHMRFILVTVFTLAAGNVGSLSVAQEQVEVSAAPVWDLDARPAESKLETKATSLAGRTRPSKRKVVGRPKRSGAGDQKPKQLKRSTVVNADSIRADSNETQLASYIDHQAVQAAPSVLSHQFSAAQGEFITLNTTLTYPMLDFQNRQTDKELLILQDAQQGVPAPNLTVGAQVRGSALFGRTNTRDSFPYLGRFPPDFTGNTVTDLRLLQSNQAIVAHANSWAHGYFETLFSDVFTFPTFEQGSFQVRQAYLVLGDLNASPLYAFLGKKNVSFGSFETLSPFTQAVPWHYFAPLAEGGGIGFSSNGFNVQLMGLNGGRGIRVTDSNNFGHINNFAANIRYEAEVDDGVTLAVGAGYLHGTIYDVAVPEHIDPTAFGPRNGAWDINAQLRAGALRLAAEFVQTQREWPATGHHITAFQLEAAHDFQLNDVLCTFSVSFSEGRQGPDGSQFEFNRQLVLGLKAQPSPNAFFTLEYVRSTGFAPLIDITTVSDRGVEQNSLVAGFVLAI